MALLTPVIYLNAMKELFSGGINWETDTIKVALVGSGYTPNQDTHDAWDDVSANELAAGGGYVAGGVSLSGKTLTLDAATNKLTLKATSPSFTNITGTFKHLVFYKYNATASLAKLIAYATLGAARTLAGDNYEYTIGTDGLITMTIPAP